MAEAPDPVAVGLVGAGPWASLVHAPMLASSPHTHLAGVWARRQEPAAALADRHGTVAFDDLDRLLEACEAVAFCVPPAVQAELAVRAATAGRHLLLEKPIAADLAGAEGLVEAVDAAGVASLVVLSWRYAPAVRAFLTEVSELGSIGGRGIFVSGALLGGMFATPWRLERGPLLDLGPHVIDLLDAALGPVVSVRAHGDRLGWVGLLLEHRGGTWSEASLCATWPGEPDRAGVEVFGRSGPAGVDCATAVGADAFAAVAEELATAIRTGVAHPLDAQRGLHLQRILADAEGQLDERATDPATAPPSPPGTP
ncbi:MAG: Gfo/Idh/MocA family oxidoreductase [Acidimicrobiales bacterium]